MQGQQPFPSPDHTQLDYPPPPDHTQLDYPPPAGYPPPPPSESRLPYPPPNMPQGPPPAGQPPYYGAPIEQDMSDTQRMLQPKGLLRGAPQFGEYQFSEHGEFGPPPPWPGGPAGPGGGAGEYGGPDYGVMPPGMGGYPGGPGGPMGRPRRSYRGVVIGSALAIVVIVGLVLVVKSMGGGGGSPTAAGTTPTGTSSSGGTPTASASAAAASQQAEKAAATRLAALLPQSGKDRTAVIDAVVNVEGCKSLPSAAAAFTASANNRQNLLSKLGTLQGRSALPGALVSSLTTAWQASVEADNDLAKWASNAATHGCKKGPPKGPIYSASLGPDNQATIGKTDFVRQWNSLATKFGLQTYSVGQL